MIVYRFLTAIVGSWAIPDPSAAPVVAAPSEPSALPDPNVTSSVTGVVASATAGLIDFTVAFAIPAYDPTLFNQVVEVHAISYGPNDTIPTDPNEALASKQPQGSSTTHSLFEGVTVTATVVGCQPGSGTIATVVGFMEPDPSTPATSTLTPSATPSTDPSTSAATTPATAAASATS